MRVCCWDTEFSFSRQIVWQTNTHPEGKRDMRNRERQKNEYFIQSIVFTWHCLRCYCLKAYMWSTEKQTHTNTLTHKTQPPTTHTHTHTHTHRDRETHTHTPTHTPKLFTSFPAVNNQLWISCICVCVSVCARTVFVCVCNPKKKAVHTEYVVKVSWYSHR